MISLSLYKVSENKKLKISNLENARSENGSLPVIVSVTIKAEENGNGGGRNEEKNFLHVGFYWAVCGMQCLWKAGGMGNGNGICGNTGNGSGNSGEI